MEMTRGTHGSLHFSYRSFRESCVPLLVTHSARSDCKERRRVEREREPVRREDMTGHPASLSRLLHSLPAGSFTSATGKSRDTMAGTRSGPSLTLTLPTPFPLSLVSSGLRPSSPRSLRSRSGTGKVSRERW